MGETQTESENQTETRDLERKNQKKEEIKKQEEAAGNEGHWDLEPQTQRPHWGESQS